MAKKKTEPKGTTVYGASDDLIEFEGGVSGEVGCYGTDDRKHGVLLVFSDGTILEAKYGKSDMDVWGIQIINQGQLLDGVKPCNSEDDDPYSDVATFRPGLTWAYAANKWERVK